MTDTNHTDSVEADAEKILQDIGVTHEDSAHHTCASYYNLAGELYGKGERQECDCWRRGDKNYLIEYITTLQATHSQQVEEAVRKSQPSLLTVGYHNGEMDFGVNCSIDELTYEQMRDFREMVCVAIGQAEQMWRKRWTGKEPCAGTLTPNHQD